MSIREAWMLRYIIIFKLECWAVAAEVFFFQIQPKCILLHHVRVRVQDNTIVFNISI